ncbi:MAG: imidazoleglycerol-phosphate dehydratase HisB [Clostridium sp.]
MKREAIIVRKTNETDIALSLELDGTGIASVQTGVGFFDHMIKLLVFHSGFNLDVKADGDLEVCDHHMVEDVGIALGKLFNSALGEKLGIKRYSSMFLPMDETLVMIALDISGRPFLHFEGDFKREKIGDFSTEMVEEFLRAFAFNAGITLHVRILYGTNDHHKVEAIFKALGRCLKEASQINGISVPSSKGVL